MALLPPSHTGIAYMMLILLKDGMSGLNLLIPSRPDHGNQIMEDDYSVLGGMKALPVIRGMVSALKRYVLKEDKIQ